ncbi:hypothetical protein MMC34_006677 [Xylographa carneopallida]|nr:hypothetical protein [Xylographa carneopallida]
MAFFLFISVLLLLSIQLRVSRAVLRIPSRPLQALRPPPPILRPNQPPTGRPRLPLAPNNNPLTNPGRTGLVCLSCPEDNSSPSSQQRLDQEATMERVFGSRASFYDNAFHRQMADDYLKWIDLEPGQNLIDMACGTGLISIPAKNLVGPSGRVVGIDISGGMLKEARRKARQAGADVTFLQDDVTELKDDAIPFQADVITCAAAFVLLRDSVPTLRQWTSYLKPGGRIIFDIPTESSRLTGQALALLTQELELPPFYGTTRAQIADSLRKLLEDAGLRPLDVFPSPVYRTVEYEVYNGLGKLRQALDAPSSPWKTDAEARQRATEIYIGEFAKRMGRNGLVREDIWFYVGVGVKGGPVRSSLAKE